MPEDDDSEGFLLRRSEDLVDGINSFINKHAEEANKIKLENSKVDQSLNTS